MTARSVSVVIPTHNRQLSVERALRALCAQSYPAASMDIIVVADGCTDRTAEVAAGNWPLRVRAIEQPPSGPAAARNRGADAATGDLLIFVDDDIEVSAQFVAEHVAGHDGARTVVIGYLPPELQERHDFLAIMLRAWWEMMFDRMREPGHRFAYSDLLSGNFSLSRALLSEVGGFDERLRCHEDYELGYRLIAAGAQMRFAAAAAGSHHEYTDLGRALRRKRDEGHADVALAHRHPALIPALPLSGDYGHLSRRGRTLMRMSRTRPAAGDALERLYRGMLPLLEGVRLRTRWRRLVDDLLLYWYWRGVGEAIDAASFDSLGVKAERAQAFHDVDLRAGLDAAARQIDDVRPEAIRLRWGPLVVGTLDAQAGAEPLQGRHLRSFLEGRFSRRLAEVMVLARLLRPPSVD